MAEVWVCVKEVIVYENKKRGGCSTESFAHSTFGQSFLCDKFVNSYGRACCKKIRLREQRMMGTGTKKPIQTQ